MNAKRLTNTELVMSVMTETPYPITACTFVVATIKGYCDAVKEAGEAEIARMFIKSGTANLINPAAWYGTCVELAGKMDACADEPITGLVTAVYNAMEISQYGAMVQMVAMHALESYGTEILGMTDEQIDALIEDGCSSEVHEWRAVAADLKAKLEARRQ